MIKSRKHPPQSTRRLYDTRMLGVAVVSLTAFDLARAAAPEQPRVMQGVTVSEEVEEGYKVEEASSPKFTAPLLDTPQTVTVIKKELLDDQGVGSLAEALRNTPGITFTLGENGNTTAGDSITMRGFDTSTSIFLDGVRDLGAVSRDTFNTEQIEVVKGPSGSDNGRGAPTGYINMSSKQPTLVDAAASSLAMGTDKRIRFEGDINHALGNWDGAAVRLSTMYDRGDAPGRDVVDHHKWGFAPSLALGLGTNTRAYFNYLFMKQNNTPDGGLPPIGLDGYNYVSGVSVQNPTPTQTANLTALNDAINPVVGAASPVDTSNYYGSTEDFEHVRANMFTATFEHDLSGSTTLRNTSRYGRQSMERVVTGVNALGNLYTPNTTAAAAAGTATVNTDEDTWTLSRSRQRRQEINDVLTNQTNLRAAFETGPISHSLSTGVEFIYERHQNRGTVTSTPTAANLYNPSTADTFPMPGDTGAFNDGKTITAAVYLFDTLQLTEQFSLNAGLRFDRFRTEYSSVPGPGTAPTATNVTYAEASGELFTGKLGLVYKPVENGSIYAAFATSEQPPGGLGATLSNGNTNNFVISPMPGANNVNNPNLDPQKARNIEIGTKWDLLDNRLVVTAAAFDTRNKNDLSTQDAVTGEITQFGERKVRGFELGASGMILPNWQVSAGFASMDTEVVEGTAATTGAQLTYSPKTTFTSWTTYEFAFGLRIGGGARYTSSQARNGNATQPTNNLVTIPDTWVVDAMAAYDVNERISLQLNVQNLTDEFYFSTINTGGSRYILGAPRTFLLTGRVRLY